MATTRFSLIQWDDDTAAVDRTQFNDAFASIDNLGAGYSQTTGAPAAASADKVGFIHFNTTDETLFYCDGSDWHQINVFGNTTNSTISAITPGDSKSAGSSTELAKADHVHEMPDFGTIANLASSATSSNGSATTFAKSDHVHGIPNATISNDMLAGSITGSKLVDGTIGADQMGTNSVDTDELVDAAVNDDKLAASGLDISKFTTGTLDTSLITAGDITNTMIAHMGANTVKVRAAGTTGDPSDLSIGVSRVLGRGSSGNLTSTQVQRAMIANNAIDGTKIDDSVINSEHYANYSIDEEHYSDDSVSFRAQGFITASTGDPESGSVGDIHLKYET